MTITNWTTDARVAPLLDDIRNVAPGIRWSDVPSRSCLYGKDRVWEYVHPSIDALNAIQNEYFKALDAICFEHGDAAYKQATDAFFAQPSVADLVEAIEAERKVAA